MTAISVESGVCLGFGGTNARYAICKDGDIERFISVPTSEKPAEFFGWMGRQLLAAADNGHEWLVAGFPGPVSPDGTLVGPMVNVSGMANKKYNLRRELVASDPAVGRLLDEGFILLGVNDGNLASQAAASRLGGHEFDKTGALIVGTGIGAGVVIKDPGYANVHRVNRDPVEIGHLIDGTEVSDRYEDRYSGPALQRAHGCDPRELPASHPVWRGEGRAIGRLATTLGLMHGVNLVVPTGGVGAGAVDKYGPHLRGFMDDYRRHGNAPQTSFVPEIRFVPAGEEQVFEMYGAEGVVRDHLTSPA